MLKEIIKEATLESLNKVCMDLINEGENKLIVTNFALLQLVEFNQKGILSVDDVCDFVINSEFFNDKDKEMYQALRDNDEMFIAKMITEMLFK